MTVKEIITDSEFKKRFASRMAGGYLFFGDEDYLKQHAIKTVREAVCPDPSLSVFNEFRLDLSANSLSPDELYAKIESALSAAPMMAERKLVTVEGLFADELRSVELDAICRASALVDEFDFNVFIISVPAGMLDPGRPKAPSEILKKLGENLVPVNFEYVSESRLAAWILRHFEHNGVRADVGVAADLVARCGRNMFTLSGEIDKLCAYVKWNKRDSVSAEDVANVTCLYESFDSFALGSAIADGNGELALRILATVKAQKTEPVAVMGELSKTLADMLTVKLMSSAGISPAEIATAIKTKSDYRVKLYLGKVRNMSVETLSRAVGMCADADLALKTSSGGYGEIEKLICAI